MTGTRTEVETEVKWLEVDPGAVAERIRATGGEHVADREMRRYVYDLVPGEPQRWIRLRDTGSEVTLCVKEIVSDAVDGVRETETTVGDFETAHALLEKFGYTPKGYQENRRSSWLLDGVRLEIDTWPRIPPYLEIEADTPAQVWDAAERLTIPRSELTAENTVAVYRKYGIDLTAIPDLRFAADTESSR